MGSMGVVLKWWVWSGGEWPAPGDEFEGRGVGRKDAGAPRDDFDGAAHASEGINIAIGGSLYLDAVGAHDKAAGEAPAIGEGEGGALAHDFGVELISREGGTGVEAEGGAEGVLLGGVQHAPEQRLAGVGGETADPHVFVGQPVPDG